MRASLARQMNSAEKRPGEQKFAAGCFKDANRAMVSSHQLTRHEMMIQTAPFVFASGSVLVNALSHTSEQLT